MCPVFLWFPILVWFRFRLFFLLLENFEFRFQHFLFFLFSSFFVVLLNNIFALCFFVKFRR